MSHRGPTTLADRHLFNAVIDALSDLGIKHMDMPLTSEKVWRAIQEARA